VGAPVGRDHDAPRPPRQRERAARRSHFLGAVVLDHETPLPGEVSEFAIIGGQQRLTTLQVILAAAANVCAGLGAIDEAEITRELVRNNPKKVSGVDLFKGWPTNANRSAFQAVMSDGGPPPDREDDPNNRIDDVYAFFYRAIREWAGEVAEEERERRLRLLRITLCDLLKVVSITLEAEDNAQVIFETLNARGAPLLAFDLVKNAVFLEAAKQGLDTDQLYESVWKPEFDDPDDDEYWRTERRQGRLNRPIGELFLTHWLTMTLRKVVPATELFATFRTNILSSVPTPQMAELIPELRRDAHTMRSFDDQEPGSVEATVSSASTRSTRRRRFRSFSFSFASRRSASSGAGGHCGCSRAGSCPEVFDETAIDARGAFLAKRIIPIWPGPDAWESQVSSASSRSADPFMSAPTSAIQSQAVVEAPMHPNRVPGAEQAVVEDSKLLDYALSLEHEVGRRKARFFHAIGYWRDDYEEFKFAILEALPYVEGRFVKKNPDDADNWEAIITIRRRDRDGTADICTVWEVREGRPTRLITVYPA
jgi:hypothetical protein